MTATNSETTTIWQALDEWAGELKSWQRSALAYALKGGVLNDEQINEVYERFVEEGNLEEKKTRADVPFEVTGRPANVTNLLRLERVDGLSGINALPDGSSLLFGPGLTVVYGRNGAGKSGFARLFANACFSRHKPQIIPNIYDENAPTTPKANFHITIDGTPQDPLLCSPSEEHAELRRISFFDMTVARLHVSQAAAFEFKPAGFDVFPEMVRVYAQISRRLESNILAKTHESKVSDSFIGEETSVSKAVAAVSASTDLSPIRVLANYGVSEEARFKEVEEQLIALKGSSPKELLERLQQARSDVVALTTKVSSCSAVFSASNATRRAELSTNAKETARAANVLGSEQFRRPFFSAIGTSEWQEFTKAAHALGRKEGDNYPTSDDHCLLCERPLDDQARAHVAALFAFVEGDARKKAQLASEAVQGEIVTLEEFDSDIFPLESRVREHIRRIDPKVEVVVVDAAAVIAETAKKSLESLRTNNTFDGIVDLGQLDTSLSDLINRIDADIERLTKDDRAQAIATLDLERQTLRHREVLSQLFPTLERHVSDAAWRAKAERMKPALNPRHITEKEKELFGKIVGESYGAQLARECERLDCALPIQLQTAGQKGETVRSLSMKSGHRPDVILSEGEQKAVALADFLTEVALNAANAAIVLDDPVTSQDHQRKERIAHRLVDEAKTRQVIVFTHDLPFLNQIISRAETAEIDLQTHWVDRDTEGRPGIVTLNDAPATSKVYDTTEKARQCLAAAQKLSGTPRHQAICNGMGALRRTIEETIAKRLLKGVVLRWEDRIIVTGLRKIAWDEALADDLVGMFEELSAYIEGHSHTDEASGAPPESKDLEQRITAVDLLIKRAKPDRASLKSAAG